MSFQIKQRHGKLLQFFRPIRLLAVVVVVIVSGRTHTPPHPHQPHHLHTVTLPHLHNPTTSLDHLELPPHQHLTRRSLEAKKPANNSSSNNKKKLWQPNPALSLAHLAALVAFQVPHYRRRCLRRPVPPQVGVEGLK